MIKVSQQQVNFFDELLNEKQFPAEAGTEDELRAQFAELDKKTGSEWVEKAIALPQKDEGERNQIAPPF